ncbi:MAG: ABC transporter ATP-binding protein [Verrucomicrobiota bacterium]
MTENDEIVDSETEKKEANNWTLIRWMLGLCWQERSLFVAAAALQVLLTCFAVFGLNLVGLGIDYLGYASGSNAEEPSLPFGWVPPEHWEHMSVILAIAAGAMIAAVCNGVLFFGASISMASLVHSRLAPKLQREVFAKLQEACMRFYSKHPSGAMINRATGDIQAVRSFVDMALVEAIALLITVSIYAVFMFRIHSGLAAACLVFVPMMIFGSARFSTVSRPLFKAYRESFDKMIFYLSEAIRGAEVIRGFSIEKEAIEKMRSMNDEIWGRQKKIFHSISTYAPTINFLSHTSLFVLLVFGGYLVTQDELSLGAGLVVFAGLLQQFANRIGNVAQIANAMQESLTGARRLRELLDVEPSVAQPEKPAMIEKFVGSVCFERASVSYTKDRNALEEIDFEVKPGEVVALAGETGSGKSSLLNLIPRLYDPDTGRVYVSGVDAREIDLNTLRRNVGVVFQEAFIFSKSIADNIRFGDAKASLEKVMKAAKIACAHEFIQDLDDGYDTVIGEMGVDLSGGQRQRLSIARALLTDPKILLLDDPTSAIDPSTEARIFEGLRSEISSRTVFIVAHRLSTLARADRVVVLERGRIVQAGTHEALKRLPGPYCRMMEAQDGLSMESEALTA